MEQEIPQKHPLEIKSWLVSMSQTKRFLGIRIRCPGEIFAVSGLLLQEGHFATIGDRCLARFGDVT